MESLKPQRFEDNPKEKEFFDKFLKSHHREGYSDMENIVFGTNERGRPKDYLSEREKEIVVSTIQWLGSPVGQGFLNGCGFISQDEIDKKR